MRVTFTGYALVSVALSVAVVANAFRSHPQFYSACVHLSKSNVSVLILFNALLLAAMLFSRFWQRVFFGRLRAIEVEHASERVWFATSEACLAMTIFRDEFDSRFLMLFIGLISVKLFHWLSQDRVDYMEQSPTVTRLFHIRYLSLTAILLAIDATWLYSSVDQIWTNGPSMIMLFALEYAVLLTMLLTTFVKYCLHCVDMYGAAPWESKSMYIFYLEFVADFIRMALYLTFFFLIFHFYSFPLHILRDLYHTIRSFVVRLRDLIQYRRATFNMNERYPDANEEEMRNVADRTCIICREEMETAKRLPCGHLFHFHCLRSWLERQQTCPTCRTSVLSEPTRRPTNAAANDNVAANAAAPAAAPSPQAAAAQDPAVAHLHAVPSRDSLSDAAGSSRAGSAHASTTGLAASPSLGAMGASQQLTAGLVSQIASGGGVAGLTPLADLRLPSDTVVLPVAAASVFTYDTTQVPQLLTIDELRRMEGEESSHFEQRLQFMQGIQAHINGLVAQMLQFQQTTGRRRPAAEQSANDAGSSSAR